MYLWIRLPPGAAGDGGDDDVAFCRGLVASTGVALSPGQGFGPGGRGFVRVALVQPEPVLEACAERMGAYLILAGAGSGAQGGSGRPACAAAPAQAVAAVAE